jgi:coenzyme F420 hydrogenase subunit beta
MKIFGSNELFADVIQKDLCIGCGACVSLCPYFKNHRGATVRLFPCTSETGRCFAYCPKVEVDLDELSNASFGKDYSSEAAGPYLSIHVAKAGKKLGAKDFQAGGAVTALVTAALKTKIADAAILTGGTGIKPVPKIVKTAKQVAESSASKYAATPTLSAFNEAVKKGFKNLAVVGTPCQVLSLAKMRLNPTRIENFIDPTAIVIGLFCTWALDYERLEAFLKDKLDITTIKKFDIPPPPAEVFVVYTHSGKLTFPLSEIRGLVPNSCSYCFDMTAEFADISVGVLEGRPDMNTLIVRTDRGRSLVDMAVEKGYLEIDDMPEANLEHLKTAAANKKKRSLTKSFEESKINNESERSYLRVSPKTIKALKGTSGGKP